LQSLLDLPLSPPPSSSFSSPAPSLHYKLVPAIVSFNKACVLDRRRIREASTRKTTVCRAWEETGRCNYRNRCKFAHGVSELRRVDGASPRKEELSTIRFRTMPCLKYSLLGACPYEDKCTYQHGPSLDIEKCISDELGREESPFLPPVRSDSLESLCSTTSSVSSLPSPSFDPFFTPRDAKTNNFEIRPF
ncbi:hypothetical protein PMAYCL1PPCAC_07205, partial [Pristionchus mayeri]